MTEERSVREVLEKLLQDSGAEGYYQTDTALSALKEIVLGMKKEIITGNYAIDITPFLEDNTKKEIFNQAVDEIASLFGGKETE